MSVENTMYDVFLDSLRSSRKESDKMATDYHIYRVEGKTPLEVVNEEFQMLKVLGDEFKKYTELIVERYGQGSGPHEVFMAANYIEEIQTKLNRIVSHMEVRARRVKVEYNALTSYGIPPEIANDMIYDGVVNVNSDMLSRTKKALEGE